MRFIRILLSCALPLALPAAAQSASYSHSTAPTSASAAPRGVVCGTEFLTQSASQTITIGNAVSCNTDGVVHVENSYYRAYDLSAFPAGFDVCAVEIGIDRALAGSGSAQPVTLNLYVHSGGAFPTGTSTLLTTLALAVANQSGSLLSVPIGGRVPAGSQLIVEVLTPDAQAAGHSFFMGSNALGQSADSFLRAPNCGVFAPTSNVASGFSAMQIVLNARGAAAPGVAALTPVPAVIDFGHVLIGQTELRVIRLINTGTASADIASIAFPPSPFALVGDTCSGRSLALGAGCALTYSFLPLSTETVSTSLLVASNAAPTNIGMSGAGALALPLPGPRLGLIVFLALLLLWLGARAVRVRRV
jgi:hypothetical protein